MCGRFPAFRLPNPKILFAVAASLMLFTRGLFSQLSNLIKLGKEGIFRASEVKISVFILQRTSDQSYVLGVSFEICLLITGKKENDEKLRKSEGFTFAIAAISDWKQSIFGKFLRRKNLFRYCGKSLPRN
jgi:hypothetical protein